MKIDNTLQLPCGVEIKNRFLKSAMTEGIANSDALANSRHVNLYERWAKGGAGISITGNVQIDHRYIERAGNVVIEGTQTNESLAALANWSQAGKQNNTQLWMQLSHAGRQTPFSINKKSVAPSVKPMPTLGGVLKFGVPEELSHSQILDIIDRFINAAEIANEGITVEYETGLGRTTLDVIQSNTILLTSKINLANSERNFFLSQLELLKSVGLLNAKYLKIVK